eukprot:scaffold12602_cov20-Tisochrysis_lutea.AAC.1
MQLAAQPQHAGPGIAAAVQLAPSMLPAPAPHRAAGRQTRAWLPAHARVLARRLQQRPWSPCAGVL